MLALPAEHLFLAAVAGAHRGADLCQGDRWTLDRTGLGPLRPEDFPAEENRSTARFKIVMTGPGDEVWVPSLVEWHQ